MISDVVKVAKIALGNVDKSQVVLLLERVNMTVQEREVVERSELAGERMCDIAESFSLSIDSVSYIKRNAMRKIGVYITEKLM